MKTNKRNFIHIGAYNRNLGDNIALHNVRVEFNKNISNINWISYDIGNFWAINNNIDFVKEFFLKNDFDSVIVGGGGLIEYKGYENMETNFKLPFNKEIINCIKCPLHFVSLGINYFRGLTGFDDNAKANLKDIIECSSSFSLRNDGSINILNDLGLSNKKVKVIPDPGLIFDYRKDRKFENFINNAIQPAFNSNEIININRFLEKRNLNSLISFAKDESLITIPHTPKDFKYLKNFFIKEKDIGNFIKFQETSNSIKCYLEIDNIIAMRGHGQLISIGLNIPGIYFSTQDKVEKFSLLNGFEKFNVDIRNKEWETLLKESFRKLKEDLEFRNHWYEIRDKNIKNWKNIFQENLEFCSKISINFIAEKNINSTKYKLIPLKSKIKIKSFIKKILMK